MHPPVDGSASSRRRRPAATCTGNRRRRRRAGDVRAERAEVLLDRRLLRRARRGWPLRADRAVHARGRDDRTCRAATSTARATAPSSRSTATSSPARSPSVARALRDVHARERQRRRRDVAGRDRVDKVGGLMSSSRSSPSCSSGSSAPITGHVERPAADDPRGRQAVDEGDRGRRCDGARAPRARRAATSSRSSTSTA